MSDTHPPRHDTGPAARYRRKHPRLRNVLAEHEERASLGQRVADWVTAWVGSWPFIIGQSALLLLWIAANVYLAARIRMDPGFIKVWDPYPFILLNLVLSFQAAYTGPVVMMSQNRQAEKDRLMAQHDYEVNLRAEEEVEVVMQHLVHQDRLLLDAIARLEAAGTAGPAGALAGAVERLLRQMEEHDRRIVAVLEHLEHRGPAGG